MLPWRLRGFDRVQRAHRCSLELGDGKSPASLVADGRAERLLGDHGVQGPLHLGQRLALVWINEARHESALVALDAAIVEREDVAVVDLVRGAARLEESLQQLFALGSWSGFQGGPQRSFGSVSIESKKISNRSNRKSPKSSNGRKIARMARILTIF